MHSIGEYPPTSASCYECLKIKILSELAGGIERRTVKYKWKYPHSGRSPDITLMCLGCALHVAGDRSLWNTRRTPHCLSASRTPSIRKHTHTHTDYSVPQGTDLASRLQTREI